jgi:tetratricopeptide (TPR) repeat protein
MKIASTIPAACLCLAAVSCTQTVRDTSLHAPPVRVPAKHTTGVSRTLHQQVINAVQAGEGDSRVAGLRHRLGANPDDLQARLELAALYKQAGFPELALEHYRIGAQRSPESAELTILLARTLNDEHLTTEARQQLERFTAANPDASAEAWSWLGIFSDAQSDYTAGERSHRAALRLRDGSDALHNNLGYNLLLQKRNGEAAVEFRKALEISPGSQFARNNLGIALAEEPGQAVQQWQNVSDTASAHSNLAALLIEKGDYSGARRELDVALGYRKDHPAALHNLQLLSDLDGGSVLLPSGRPESSWRRFVRSVGIVVLGPETETKPAPAKRTSTVQTSAAGAGVN